MKKKNLFKKSLLIYTGVGLVLCVIFLIYIWFTLVDYEANQTGNFLKSSITSINDNTLISYLKQNNLDEVLLASYKNMLNSKDLYFKKQNDDTFVAVLNDRSLFTIATKVIGEKTKLGLFTYQEREVLSVTPNLERGLIYYDVIVPSNYKVYLDGALYSSEATESQEYANLGFMYYNDSMPKLNTYEINNLNSEKKVTAKDFLGNEVELKVDGITYTALDTSINVATLEEAQKIVSDLPDIMDIAHNWSFFMSRDLTGSYYGFTNIISPLLIKGTDLYQLAYNWAHNIDIRFISKHTLKNPIWTNEKLNNFIIYGKDAFACEVYTEKNMVVKGNDQQDIMHDYLYFIKDEGVWKLINIVSVVEDNNE